MGSWGKCAKGLALSGDANQRYPARNFANCAFGSELSAIAIAEEMTDYGEFIQ